MDIDFNKLKEERKKIIHDIELKREMEKLNVTQKEIDFLIRWYTHTKTSIDKRRNYLNQLIIEAYRNNEDSVRLPMGVSLNVNLCGNKFHEMYINSFGSLEKAYLREKEIKNLKDYGMDINIERYSSLKNMTRGILRKEYNSCRYTEESVDRVNEIIEKGGFKYIFSKVCKAYISKYLSDEVIQNLNINVDVVNLICSDYKFPLASPIVYLELEFNKANDNR